MNVDSWLDNYSVHLLRHLYLYLYVFVENKMKKKLLCDSTVKSKLGQCKNAIKFEFVKQLRATNSASKHPST